MKKQAWKSRQAAGLRRASLKRGVSIEQWRRMNARADRLLREAKADRERLARMQAQQRKF
jgi:hypothetical protein